MTIDALDGLRVLLVDDAPEIRMLLRVVLEDAGCEVSEAVDAASGLLAATAPFDLVLLDVQLPDLEGPLVLSRLRQDPRTAALPVVFLTAAQDRDAELVAAGALGVLRKPMDILGLPGALAALLTSGS